MADEFGDRMKMYEGVEAQRKLMPLLPIIARIDGRSFSTFTQGLPRPYCDALSQLMINTTRHLVQETGACIGYTQSDEISLIIQQREFDSQVYFGGRIQKIVSQLAAQASVYFNRHLDEYLPEKSGLAPTFDSRVWNVPNQDEAANVILWRELDATKNSVSMATRAYYSHKAMDGKGRADMMDMLHAKGINWSKDYPAFFKRGTFIQRCVTSRKFTGPELAKLPPGHNAHKNPDLMVERTDYIQVDMPPFGRVSNRVGVIFNGEAPLVVGGIDANDL